MSAFLSCARCCSNKIRSWTIRHLASALFAFALVGQAGVAFGQACVSGNASPPGCTVNGSGAGIATSTNSARHGDNVCFSVSIQNTCIGCCDLRNLDTDLTLPDGSVIPITSDATVNVPDAFDCPSADPRCITPSNPICTNAGTPGYLYVVSHDDEHGKTGVSCPPLPSPGIGQLSAYTLGIGQACRAIPVGATICKALAINVPHGACCEPCSGTCQDDVSINECLPPSTFTPGARCANVCTQLDCNDGDDCTTDRCVELTPGKPPIPAHCESTHYCEEPPSGFTCNDGLDCTNDSCVNDTDPGTGCCAHGPICPPDAVCCADDAPGGPSSCDDDDPCTVDVCNTAGCCEHRPLCEGDGVCCAEDRNACDDNNVCTFNVCVEEECCENPPITCPPVPCMRNTGCDPVAGCQYVFDCRQPGNNCCPKGGECSTSTCNPKTGECQLTPDCRGDDGCNDQNVCTLDNCTDDGCCENTPVVCEERPCYTVTGCDPKLGCQYTSICSNPDYCNDNNVCTTDSCDEAEPGCCKNTPIVCEERPCYVVTGCDPVQGCQYRSVCSTPGYCNDNNVCTSDTCDESAQGCCVFAPISCPPRPCQRLTGCDPVAGCQYTPDCREPGENCCPDTGGECSATACDPNTGICGSTPNCDDDHDCKDDDLCTDDFCTSEGCCEHKPKECKDDNDCTSDSCDPEKGCIYEPGCKIDHDCKDDDFCTDDFCTSEGCCEHKPKECKDDNDCTSDSCDPEKGCIYEPGCKIDHDCKDDDFCTDDFCTSDGCCEHKPKECKDDNDCTTDSCDPEKGCEYEPECDDDHDCKDNNLCTEDLCNSDGCCEHHDRKCKDSSDCTEDSCDPTKGCVYTPDCMTDADCAADSDPCTQAVCTEGCCEQKPRNCCGNGTIENGETCDPPQSTLPNGSTCRSDCTYCGDGRVNGQEECDDGNSVNDDQCSNSCTNNQTRCDDGDPCTDDFCKCVRSNDDDDDDHDDDDWSDDDDDHNAARGESDSSTKNISTRTSTTGVGTSTASGGSHDDDDDHGDDDDDHGDDDDDHDTPSGEPCDCPPDACDDGHNVATGSHDDDDDDHSDDSATCVCVHIRRCTEECCPDCDDGNPCTEDYCESGSDHNTATGGSHDDDDDHDGGGACVCKHRNICDDNNACTTDVCNGGSCTHDAITCNDNKSCTTDTCDPDRGCVFTPQCKSNYDCPGDGDPCTYAYCNQGCCEQKPANCCGNGSINVGETCDPPGATQGNGNKCRSSCTYCGDGIVNGDEDCDDGNANPDDGCSNTCSTGGASTCRSPGFWGTHSCGTDGHSCETSDCKNVTQAALNECGGCVQVCGDRVDTTVLNDSDSTLEALCVNVEGVQKRQLARQLTAAALNCCISGGGKSCDGLEVQSFFAACNSACSTGNTFTYMGGYQVDCIKAIECFNNGGHYNKTTGYCAYNADNCKERNLGICADGSICTEGDPCGDGSACGEHGPAGSSTSCNSAKANGCYTIGSTNCAGNDDYNGPQSCP